MTPEKIVENHKKYVLQSWSKQDNLNPIPVAKALAQQGNAAVQENMHERKDRNSSTFVWQILRKRLHMERSCAIFLC